MPDPISTIFISRLSLDRRVIEQAPERFDKFIDLPPFVLLLIANDAVIGGNAERLEVKTRRVDQGLLLPVVSGIRQAP